MLDREGAHRWLSCTKSAAVTKLRAATGEADQAGSTETGRFVRPLIVLVVIVLGVAAAVWHWAVDTPLLGSRLPSAAHVALVAAFFIVSVTAVSFASRTGYRALARWSQARRARQRGENA